MSSQIDTVMKDLLTNASFGDLAKGSLLTDDEVKFVKEYVAQHPKAKKISRKKTYTISLSDGSTKSLKLGRSVIVVNPKLIYALAPGKDKALGKGNYGTVKYAQNILTNKIAVDKRITLEKPLTEKEKDFIKLYLKENKAKYEAEQQNQLDPTVDRIYKVHKNSRLKVNGQTLILRRDLKVNFNKGYFKVFSAPAGQSLKSFRRESQVENLYGLSKEHGSVYIPKSGKGHIFMELSGKSLWKQRDDIKKMSFATKLEIVIGSLEELKRFHDHKIIHRDIKGGNILYDPSARDPKKRVRLIDLGFHIDLNKAKKKNLEKGADGELYYHSNRFDKDVNYKYWSPEATSQSKGNKFSKKSDIYGMGFTLLGEHDLNFTEKPQDAPDDLFLDALSILQRMIHADPSKRPDVDVALKELKSIQKKLKQQQAEAEPGAFEVAEEEPGAVAEYMEPADTVEPGVREPGEKFEVEQIKGQFLPEYQLERKSSKEDQVSPKNNEGQAAPKKP